MYTDPEGEFFIGTVFTVVGDFLSKAFLQGGLHPTSSSARNHAWKMFDPTAIWSLSNKAWKIDVGGFKTNPNRNFWGRSWQLISRWTWELPQTVAGNTYSHLRNMTGNVSRVDYLGGATFVTQENQDSRWGVTLGSYININIKDEIEGSFEDRVISDPLFMHEYGHIIDSQIFGVSYLFAVSVPSIISASNAAQVKGEPSGLPHTTLDGMKCELTEMQQDILRNITA